MNPDLLSANFSLAFLVAAAAALLAHLIAASRRGGLTQGVAAIAAAGLVYLLGTNAFGWGFLPREALFALYAALFALGAAMAIVRRVRGEGGGAPLGAMIVQQAAMAGLFVPPGHWKPPVSAIFAIYFLVELAGWLKGSEPDAETPANDPRPPLFPPKRVRGLREFAGAALAGAFVYVFVMGMGKEPVPPPAPAAQEAPAEEPASDAGAPDAVERAEEPASETAAAASAATVYKAAAGDTLKSIARKLYGKADKWREIARANPGLKPGARLKAGQAITLPAPPVK